MRTCPPRERISDATDCPAESCEPLVTLMPVPASRAAPWPPSSVGNSSPITAGDWAWAEAQAERNSIHERTDFKVRLRTGIKATALVFRFSSLVYEIVFL